MIFIFDRLKLLDLYWFQEFHICSNWFFNFLQHSSLEFEITLKSISTYKLYTIFFLMTSALIWVHLLNDWKGRFGGLTPTGLAPPPIFGRKIVQFLHSQYLGQSQQKEKNIVLWWVSWRENSVFCFMHIGWKGAILVWELIIFGTKQQYL